MPGKRVLDEARDIRLATELVALGARLQVLEGETRLSREKLLRLYKELRGKSPPKGMLPFSTDWFLTWLPNVHASLFVAIHDRLAAETGVDGAEALVKAYRLYREYLAAHGLTEVLSVTRAWRLLRFIDAGMLATAPCTRCGGRFVVHAHDPVRYYVCGLCDVPARAGKTKARAAQALAQ